MKEALPWSVCWACRTSTRDFCMPWLAWSAVQTIFFLAAHYFNAFALIAQQAGQAVKLGRLYLSMCLWSCQLF
jgi:hypothetical protein